MKTEVFWFTVIWKCSPTLWLDASILVPVWRDKMLMHSADVMMLGNGLSCLYNHLTALSDTQARQSCLFTLLLILVFETQRDCPHQSQRDECTSQAHFSNPLMCVCVCVYTYLCVPSIHPVEIPHLMRSYNLHPHLPNLPPQSPVQPTLMKLIESEIDNA